VYLPSQKRWLRQVAADLSRWCLEPVRYNLLNVAEIYFYFYVLPATEMFCPDFTPPQAQPLVRALFWLTLNVRFVDFVIDKDEPDKGLETSVFLQNYALQQALDHLRQSGHSALDLGSFWRAYHRLYRFQTEMTRPFHRVTFAAYAKRHWERGAILFWMPARMLATSELSPSQRTDRMACLKAYFDLALAPDDLLHVFSDYRNWLNTPATLLFREPTPDSGLSSRFARFRSDYWNWIEKRYRLASRIAERHGLAYTRLVTQHMWDSLTVQESV
jgi:hypothetical protein